MESAVSADPIVRLVVSCEDRPGIVAAVAGFLSAAGANILTSDQYSRGNGSGRFFLRMQFERPAGADLDELERRFQNEVGAGFGMQSRIWRADRPKRVAVMVSKYDHCLQELLWRWRRGELGGAELTTVTSNHPDLRDAVEGFGLPYHHVPVEKGRKAESEEALFELLAGQCDLIVLARYMQILSGELLERLGVPVINIHHSFLPAFAGAGPYERAKERGVKLIGATAHYVTEELDAGPIVEQDVIRVDHTDSAGELKRLGADIERAVLARAVQWHCEDRVLLDGNTTVVF
jgi:formyltetrahydrofolate deformylase